MMRMSPKRHQSFRPCRPFAVVLAGFGLASLNAAATAQVSLSLSPVAHTTATTLAVDEVRFDLLALNDADSQTSYPWPATLPCRLTTPAGVVDVVAARVGADGTVPLAAHSFARETYVVHQRTAGRVVIELTGGVAAATIVNVEPPGSPASARQDVVDGGDNEQKPPRNPIEAVTQRDPNFKSENGLVEFLSYRIKAHEPVYILAGNDDPVTKFQFSFKYQLFDPNGPIAQKVPALAGIYFGYSQTSFWQLDGNSNPFFDTSYRPEALVSYDNLDRYLLDKEGDRALPDWLRLGFQGGVKHESNGRDGDASRSVNIVYARPIITFSGRDGWFLTLAPSVFTYIADLSDNPDIDDYRGHADLRAIIGQGGGVQLAATGRFGKDFDKGSLQLDLTFPIRQLTLGNLDVYFDTQYFTGYGESLIRYNEREQTLRFGVSLVR